MGTIAKEYKNFNITCNIISLGYFETKMWKSLPTKNKVNFGFNSDAGSFEIFTRSTMNSKLSKNFFGR